MLAMPEGERPQDMTQKELKDAVWKELQAVRRHGVARLDEPEEPGSESGGWPQLEAAARRVPGWRPNMTMSGQIAALLRYAVARIEASSYHEQLVLLFGLRDGLPDTKPKVLRDMAAAKADEPRNTYIRYSPLGTELKALYALASQIVADCLQSREEDSRVASNEPKPSVITNPQLYPIGGRHHRRKLMFAALGVVVLVVTLVVATLVSNGHPTGQPEVSTGSNNPIGHALRPMIFGMTSLGGSGSVAFMANQRSVADGLVNKVRAAGTLPGYPAPDLIGNVLDAGGYLYGGMILHLQLESLDHQEVTVYDIRPLARRGPMALDTAILIPAGGAGPTTRIGFTLDQAHPVPMEVPLNAGVKARPFFQVESIGLGPGQKEILVMYFYANAASFVFDLAFDYEVGGKKYTQVVDNDGKHFRTTAAPCPLRLHKSTLSSAQAQALKNQHYTTIWKITDGSESGPVQPMSLAEYGRKCGDY
jgi:hypothetical protein